MRSHLQIVEAVKLVFDQTLNQMSRPIYDWQMFTPFVSPINRQTFLLKLIEVNSNLRTSDELVLRAKKQYQGILQEVEIMPVQREQESSYYLVKGVDNVIPLDLFIKMKRQAGEKVDQSIISKFLEFASVLESHPLSHKISFNLNGISLTSQNNFILTNYELYFTPSEKTKRSFRPTTNYNLSQDIKNALVRLLVLNQENEINLVELFSNVQISYGSSMLAIVQKIMNDNFKASQVATMISESNSFIDTTLTESFENGNVMCEEVHYKQTYVGAQLDEGLLSQSAKPKEKKVKKILFFSVIFILVLLGIGVVTFKYLTPRLLQCEDQQYHDTALNQCLSCDPTCDRCSGKTNNMCLSCKQDQFLMKRSKQEPNGKCGGSCRGQKIEHKKVCIVDNNQQWEMM